MEVYLDHAATTACFPEVARHVADVSCNMYGNTSSLHAKGLEAEHLMEKARKDVAALMKVHPKEIYFTSGGTESDNTAILGAVRRMQRRGRHIITTQMEHPAVSSVMQVLESEGYKVTWLRPGTDGVIRPEQVDKALRPDTILVSIMHVNNEIGTVQPLGEIGEVIHRFDSQILFHSDCVQSFGKLLLRPAKWHVDMVSVSGHKFHGPKGTGVLYIREGAGVSPILYGGGHQRGMRPGTENVPGASGLAMAAKKCCDDMEKVKEQLLALRTYFIDGLKEIGQIHIHGSDQLEEIAPHVLSVAFADVSAEVLLHSLEAEGIYVSSGSACSSNHPSVSTVLQAIDAPVWTQKSTIRFSFCEATTKEEIDYTLKCLYNCVPKLRRFVRR